MPTNSTGTIPSTRRAWGSVAITIIAYNLLLAILVVTPAFLLPEIGVALDNRGATAISLAGTLVAELIALWLLVVWLRRSGRTLADLGWKRPTTAAAIAAGALFGAAYAAYTLMIPEVRANATELSLFKVYGAAVGVIAGVVEEIVFRGFVMTELDGAGAPPWLQVLISGVTFAMIHIGFDFVGMLSTFVMGVILALVYLWGGRSLTPVAVGHGLINAVIEPWLLLFIIGYFSQAFGG